MQALSLDVLTAAVAASEQGCDIDRTATNDARITVVRGTVTPFSSNALLAEENRSQVHFFLGNHGSINPDAPNSPLPDWLLFKGVDILSIETHHARGRM